MIEKNLSASSFPKVTEFVPNRVGLWTYLKEPVLRYFANISRENVILSW